MQHQSDALRVSVDVLAQAQVLHVHQVDVALVRVGQTLSGAVGVLEPESRTHLVLDRVQGRERIVEGGGGGGGGGGDAGAAGRGLARVRPGRAAPSDGAVAPLQLQEHGQHLVCVGLKVENRRAVVEKLKQHVDIISISISLTVCLSAFYLATL